MNDSPINSLDSAGPGATVLRLRHCRPPFRRSRRLHTETPTRPGSLVCVGVGMTLGSHITPLARSHIEQADVVFTGLSDGIVELWVAGMNKDVRSLQPFYREGTSRM